MTDRPTNPTDRPGLRPAAPERASVNGHRPTDHADRPTTPTDARPDQSGRRMPRLVGFLTRRADREPRPTAPTRPAPTPIAEAVDQPTGRIGQWREGRAAAANARAAHAAATAAAAKAAAATRRATTTRTDRVAADAEVAPVPRWMKWAAVWLDRTFGAMPLAAPLIVSGFFTMQVFTDQPIGANAVVAFFATCALEGGVWKLSRLYEKTLVAGDSTIALRLGIGFYLALISGLIYWHADHQAQLNGQGKLGDDSLPAFGVAVMSALGVFIWSRTARWTRRRELHAMGRVDTQAPKFAALAWILCPVETPKALRHAVKYRIPSPVDAVEDRRLYVAAGKPAIWPPIPTDHHTPTDHAGPTDAPTDPTRLSTADPTPPPTVAVDTRPTAPAQPTRPVAPAQPAAPRPTTPAQASRPTSTDRPAFTPAAIRNAAILRSRYGTTDSLRLGTVRSDTGWSFDRADPALKAYHASADRPTDQEPETDARPFAHAL